MGFMKFRYWFNAVSRNPVDLYNFIVPLNVKEEKEAWIKSQNLSYNPTFKYDIPRLESFSARTSGLEDVLKEAIFAGAFNSGPKKTKLAYNQASMQSKALSDARLVAQQIVANERKTHSAYSPSTVESAKKAAFDLFDGGPTELEVEIAKAMADEPVYKVFTDKLVLPEEDTSERRAKLFNIFHVFLKDLRGSVTESEYEELELRNYDWKKLATVFSKAVNYIYDEARLKRPKIEIYTPEFGFSLGICTNPNASRLWFMVPTNFNLSGVKTLQSLSHETAHLRAILSSTMLSEDRAVSRFFAPRIVSRGPWNIVDEGFATLYEMRAIGSEAIILSSISIIIADYITKGHNFAETSRYFYDLIDQEPGKDIAVDDYVWETLSFFYGQSDTSGHSGFIIPHGLEYFMGVIRVLRWLIENDERSLGIMRYSNLSFHILDSILYWQRQLGDWFQPTDIFPSWNYDRMYYEKPEPLEYIKALLLND